MENELKLHLGAEVTSAEINKAARTACRKYKGLSYEDHVQDLWVWILPKNIDSLPLLRTILKYRSTDLCRKWAGERNPLLSVDYSDPLGELFLETNINTIGTYHSDIESIDNKVTVELLINTLEKGSRERKFAVCKAYLIEGYEFLEDEYMTYYNKLTLEQKTALHNCKSFSDDFIIKNFIGVKTGTNSGSARILKNNLKAWREKQELELELAMH